MCKAIFIIDDRKEQQIMQQIFDRYDLFKDMAYFLDGQSAIALLKLNPSQPENLPDLILCDLNIQLESKWKFLEAFEQLSLGKTIDFYMIADWADPADRFRAQLYPFVTNICQKPLSKVFFILLYLSYYKKTGTTDKLHTFIQSTIYKTLGTSALSSKNLSEQLMIAQQEKAALAKALSLSNTELLLQLEGKSLRAAELLVANIELDFQNLEKEKRAAELKLANIELDFQNLEKDKRATELIIANTELVFQNLEKEKRADELVIANTELVFQNREKERRASELIVANEELIYQNQEKSKRAAELVIAYIELDFQEFEKEKRAQSEAKKDAFFNLVSHELKTPLTNIKAIN
jgi:hypothetical protein